MKSVMHRISSSGVIEARHLLRYHQDRLDFVFKMILSAGSFLDRPFCGNFGANTTPSDAGGKVVDNFGDSAIMAGKLFHKDLGGELVKFMIIELMLFLLAVSAWTGTLRDNFDDGDFSGWQVFQKGDLSATWSVKNGELVCTSQDACGWSSTLMIGDESWRDYELQCRFFISQAFPANCRTSSAGIGVHFDVTTGTDAIALAMLFGNIWEATCQGVALDNDDAVQQLVGPVEQGQWYDMRIVALGNRYKLYMDNKKICEFRARPDQGGVILFAANSEVHFDNVVITGDDIPDKNLGLSVEPKAKLATTWATLKQSR